VLQCHCSFFVDRSVAGGGVVVMRGGKVRGWPPRWFLCGKELEKHLKYLL